MNSSRPLRVCHVITRLVNGGAQHIVLSLLRQLSKEDFELSIIAGPQAGEGSLWDEARAIPGVEVVECPYLVREMAPRLDLKALKWLKAHFKAKQPDVVHSHTSKAGLLGSLAAKRAGVGKVIYTPHGHIFAKDAQIPGVPKSGLKRWVFKQLRKRAHRAADLTIALNRIDQREQAEHGLCAASKLRVIRNGIDVRRFVPVTPEGKLKVRTALKLPSDALVVAAVARLSPEKGIDILIEAWPYFRKRLTERHSSREIILLIAGDGDLRDKLERSVPHKHSKQSQLAGLAPRSVRFLGEVKEPERVYQAADLVVVPSRYESQGLVALEAMACGVPVVATSVGGLPEAVRDGHTGLLCPPEDPKGMAAAMARIVNSKKLSTTYADAARRQAMEYFSLDRMVGEHAALYQAELPEPSKSPKKPKEKAPPA